MLTFACLCPHPPIMIPGIGKKEDLATIENTIEGMKRLGKDLKKANPDTIVLVSPHSYINKDSFAVNFSPNLSNSLNSFGLPTNVQYPNDRTLSEQILKKAVSEDIPVTAFKGEIDHGAWVPLYYLTDMEKTSIVHLSYSHLSSHIHYKYGSLLGKVLSNEKKSIAFVASGDLSHRLPNSHYGCNPKGAEFDTAIIDFIKNKEIDKILNMDNSLLQEAGECGYRSIAILMGLLSHYDYTMNVYSYEGPFGVGYAVANATLKDRLTNSNLQSPFVALAKETVETFVKTKKQLSLPENLSEDLYNRKCAAFVTLKIDNQLRGCCGTLAPTQENLGNEIIHSAISACSRDHRFNPVKEEELESLNYEVSVLGELEPVSDIKMLDPNYYGIVVIGDSKRQSCLLPGLEGITDVNQQIQIVCKKGGIDPSKESLTIFRFTSEKYH